MYIVGNEPHELGPVKLTTNITDGLPNPRMTGEVMIMVGSENIKSDVCMIRDIEGAFEQEKFPVLGE